MTEDYEFRHRHALAGTVETDSPEDTPQPTPQVEQPPPNRLRSPRDLAKFTGLVALFSIFTDAAVGHALCGRTTPTGRTGSRRPFSSPPCSGWALRGWAWASGAARSSPPSTRSCSPVHLMTTTGDEDLPGRLELHVGDEDTPIVGLPDRHLRVVWQEYEGGAPQGPRRARNVFGSGVLLGLLVLALLAVRREETQIR